MASSPKLATEEEGTATRSSSCEVEFSSCEDGFTSSDEEISPKVIKGSVVSEVSTNASSDSSDGDHEVLKKDGGEEDSGEVDPEDEDFLASDGEQEEDPDEEAYRRYEERTSFDHARIDIDENYEEDFGFPMYYGGYTNRKKQLPLGMDCWKVKKIPADATELREIIQDQKVRRELLARVLEELAVEKIRLNDSIATGV